MFRSELGTMQLEFDFLTHITNEPIFKEKVDKVMQYVINQPKSNGYYANYINADNGQWCNVT